MVGWFRGWSDAWFGKRKRIPMAKQGSVVSDKRLGNHKGMSTSVLGWYSS
ncbi:predicted protein [Sclerotinia sclerotiorum 1980 UF-70]|uniref:Uncharacterized protein n=1 Tax=Sclerotinia sclerotiorum (strain ATCC 18683 / 1980 / Ss-1) TaxID=665079 RepID=A7E679_SCLS1|nr:predicted protein [Sclerotinia sclerotiorum 1980 UF-70]EDN91401.1 predicted protein [Sclerotinia sclerotiorum 1980 UF-70]